MTMTYVGLEDPVEIDRLTSAVDTADEFQSFTDGLGQLQYGRIGRRDVCARQRAYSN